MNYIIVKITNYDAINFTWFEGKGKERFQKTIKREKPFKKSELTIAKAITCCCIESIKQGVIVDSFHFKRGP